MEDIQIAWAAGLFEGEGSFTYSRDKRWPAKIYLKCSMCSTDLDVLERFRDIVGFGTVNKNTTAPRQPHHKQQYYWHSSGKANFQYLADMFAPYLGKRRKARAAELLLEAGTAGVNRTPDARDISLAALTTELQPHR